MFTMNPYTYFKGYIKAVLFTYRRNPDKAKAELYVVFGVMLFLLTGIVVLSVGVSNPIINLILWLLTLMLVFLIAAYVLVLIDMVVYPEQQSRNEE